MAKSGRKVVPKFRPYPGMIRRLRMEAGITSQEDFAKKCGISAKKLGEAEASKPTTEDMLTRIGGVLALEWKGFLDPIAPENAGMLTSAHSTFHAIQPEFLRWEQSQPADVLLTADTLAIDLNDGWPFIHYTIWETRSVRIHFRIAMLTWDVNKLLPHPYEAGGPEHDQTIVLSKNAETKFERIRQKHLAGEINHPNKTVTYEIRTYCNVPDIHGLLGGKGDSQLLAFTRCRLTKGIPPEYLDGLGEYCLVPSDNGAKGLGVVANEWLQRFEDIWRKGTVVLPIPDESVERR